MANDLEIIKRLEKITGEKLAQLDIESTFFPFNGFVIASNQNVTGLKLYGSNFTGYFFS